MAGASVKPCHLVAETWACHEALRRLGFSSDDLYVIGDANDGDVVVQLQAQGKTFSVVVGPRGMPVEEFETAWKAFIVELQTISEDELMGIWERSHAREHAVPLVVALTAKGFRLSGHGSWMN